MTWTDTGRITGCWSTTLNVTVLLILRARVPPLSRMSTSVDSPGCSSLPLGQLVLVHPQLDRQSWMVIGSGPLLMRRTVPVAYLFVATVPMSRFAGSTVSVEGAASLPAGLGWFRAVANRSEAFLGGVAGWLGAGGFLTARSDGSVGGTLVGSGSGGVVADICAAAMAGGASGASGVVVSAAAAAAAVLTSVEELSHPANARTAARDSRPPTTRFTMITFESPTSTDRLRRGYPFRPDQAAAKTPAAGRAPAPEGRVF